ncbi:histidine kinase [Cohnella suwonensis]|uniref:histidine kinase n=1 Tax=Cohnella suwonensis TaxID=696072 RepID=A0ABW0LZ21_9BACL
MKRRIFGQHSPLLRTLLILVGLLACIAVLLTAFERHGTNAVKLSREDWQWAPAKSFDEVRSPEEGWSPVIHGRTIPVLAYWLRIPLPIGDKADPHLKIMGPGSLKAYDGQSIFYEHLITDVDKRTKNGFRWQIVPLPVPPPSHVDILIRYVRPYPVAASVSFGDRADLLSLLLHQDLDNLIVAALLLFSGFITLGLYSTQRQQLYIYFSLLAFAGGYGTAVCNELLQVIWDNPWPGHFQDVCLPLGTFAFLGALEQLFPETNRRLMTLLRALKWSTLAYAILATIPAFFSRSLYKYVVPAFSPLFAVVFVAIFGTILCAYRSRKDLESIWMMAGFTVMTMITFVHMYRFVFPLFMPETLQASLPSLRQLPIDLLFWGLFVLVVCLIRVIMFRYTAMNRQLTEFNRSLEQAVLTRTRQIRERAEQLEIAHEKLQASMRENAEALAEAMILEERHRITGSIHDGVGHTLSATIIQLEAAKRLAPRDLAAAEQKLTAAQGLVRRGLEDIRQSVRLLREDASYYDLTGAIGALVREKEQLSECSIERRIDPLPEDLGTLQKKLIFQTLQEGLRVGIRQARTPSRFLLSISPADGNRIEARLVHLDESCYAFTYTDFGMRVLADNAAKLGGSLTTGDGDAGFSLTLLLPVDSPLSDDHWVL